MEFLTSSAGHKDLMGAYTDVDKLHTFDKIRQVAHNLIHHMKTKRAGPPRSELANKFFLGAGHGAIQGIIIWAGLAFGQPVTDPVSVLEAQKTMYSLQGLQTPWSTTNPNVTVVTEIPVVQAYEGQSPEALRSSVAFFAAAGLQGFREEDPLLLDRVAEILELCCGQPVTVYFEGRAPTHLPAVDWDSVQQNRRCTYLMIIVRTMYWLGRSHDAWYSRLHPPTADKKKKKKRRKKNKEQTTRPNTGLGCIEYKHDLTGKKLSGKQWALNMDQETLWQDMHDLVRTIMGQRLSKKDIVLTRGSARLLDDRVIPAAEDWHDKPIYLAAGFMEGVVRTAIMEGFSRDTMTSEFRDELFRIAQLAVNTVYGFVKAHLNLRNPHAQSKTFVGARKPRTPLSKDNPHPWVDRRRVLVRMLDGICSRDPAERRCLELAVNVIQCASGEGPINYEFRDPEESFQLEPMHLTDSAYRQEMFEFMCLALVAFCQCLSANFDGRDVRLDGKLVHLGHMQQPKKQQLFSIKRFEDAADKQNVRQNHWLSEGARPRPYVLGDDHDGVRVDGKSYADSLGKSSRQPNPQFMDLKVLAERLLDSVDDRAAVDEDREELSDPSKYKQQHDGLSTA